MEPTPFTRDELPRVLKSLSQRINNDAIAGHPTTVLLTRLALTAARGVSPEPAPKPVVIQSERVERSHHHKTLQELATSEGELRKAQILAASLQSKLEMVTEERDSAMVFCKKHRQTQKELEQQIRQLRAKAVVDPAELVAVQEKLAQAQTGMAAMAQRLQEMTDRVNDIRAALRLKLTERPLPKWTGPALDIWNLRLEADKAWEATNQAKREGSRARGKVKDQVLEKLSAREYSSRHPTINFRRGNPVPCCPVCHGLDPTRVQKLRGFQVGHKRGCVFSLLKADLQGL